MEGNVDDMRKDELMKYARSLGVDTRKEGTKNWRAVEAVLQDCKVREAAQQERSRAHAGEPGSASSGVAVGSASRAPALAQTLTVDTVEPGSASTRQAQLTTPKPVRMAAIQGGTSAGPARSTYIGDFVES